MNLRLSAAIGAILGILGLVALAAPQVTTFLPASDTLVAALGGLLVLAGVREIWRRRNSDPGYAETPDTEKPVELSTPGEEFDERMDHLSTVLYRGNVRQTVREQVTKVATETLQRRFNYTESEAKTALRDGRWTDEPFAAAFFTGRPPQASALSRVRELFRSGSSFQYRTRRAIDELYRLAEEEEGERDD